MWTGSPKKFPENTAFRFARFENGTIARQRGDRHLHHGPVSARGGGFGIGTIFVEAKSLYRGMLCIVQILIGKLPIGQIIVSVLLVLGTSFGGREPSDDYQ